RDAAAGAESEGVVAGPAGEILHGGEGDGADAAGARAGEVAGARCIGADQRVVPGRARADDGLHVGKPAGGAEEVRLQVDEHAVPDVRIVEPLRLRAALPLARDAAAGAESEGVVAGPAGEILHGGEGDGADAAGARAG